MFWYCIQTDQYKDFQEELHIGWQGHVFFEEWAHTFAEKYYWKYLQDMVVKALDSGGFVDGREYPGIRSYGTVITLTLAVKLQKMEIALL